MTDWSSPQGASRPATEDRFRVLERALLDHLAPARERDRAVVVALSALERGMPVAELGARMGLSGGSSRAASAARPG